MKLLVSKGIATRERIKESVATRRAFLIRSFWFPYASCRETQDQACRDTRQAVNPERFKIKLGFRCWKGGSTFGVEAAALEAIFGDFEEYNQSRFLPSEFGIDPSRMEDSLEAGKETFTDKMVVRKAIEDAGIPYTYISANCMASYFVGNLSQLDSLLPPRSDRVSIYGDGNHKVVFLDEDDVATYTIKTVDDSRMANKTLYLRPQENILTRNQLVEKWEKLTNKIFQKVHISARRLSCFHERCGACFSRNICTYLSHLL